MTCKRGWTTEYMAANFPMTFRTITLRQHRRKVLFEREKTLLPSLQIYVEYKRDWDRLTQEHDALAREFGSEHVVSDCIAYRWGVLVRKMRHIENAITVTRREIERIKKIRDQPQGEVDPPTAEFIASIPGRLTDLRTIREASKATRETYRNEFTTLNAEYVAKRNALRVAQQAVWTAANNYNDSTGTARATKREFIMRCPADDCRGFLSTAYKCGTCEAWACHDCMVCIGKDNEAPHTCNPDTVESAKAIRAETRPCPKCGTRIFKTDGCDQMWCVMEGCGTAFSWNTGHIVTGVIHNPHYYEWLRRNGGGAAPREAGDIPCGGMPLTWQFVRAFHQVDIPNEITRIVLDSFRNMQELVNQRLPEYPARMPQLMNKEADVDYLMNLITEDEWKRKLEITEAKFNRKKEVGQILQTIVTAGSDMMNRIYERLQTYRNRDNADTDNTLDELVGWLLDTGLPELEQLRIFGNDSLKGLAKRDKMAVPQFAESWWWRGARALYKPEKKKVVPETIVADPEPTEIV